jgi:hypothetical protein
MGNKDEMTTTTQNSLQQHPLSAAFPSMPPVELEALAMDIEAHGQREPGVLFEGMVLDGWHRYVACGKAGVEFKARRLMATTRFHSSYRATLTDGTLRLVRKPMPWRRAGNGEAGAGTKAHRVRFAQKPTPNWRLRLA